MLKLAIGYLGGGDPLSTLQANGYVVSVLGHTPTKTCPSVFSAQACLALGAQLSTSIDAALAIGDSAERNAFRQGLQVLSAPPCQIIE